MSENLSGDGRRVLREEFLHEFNQRDMNHGQIMEVFDFADVDKSGVLEEAEWKAFYNIFILP